MTSRIFKAALVLALVAIIALACGGDRDPSPTATLPEETASGTPRSTGASGSPGARGWRTLAPMPTPRSEVAAATVGGKIYVVGGFEADGSTSDAVEVYDPVTDTWTQAPPLPEPRHHAAAIGTGDNLLYVIGGFATSFDDPQATVFEYSQASGWIERPPLTSPRGAHGVVQVGGGEILVLGGVGQDGSNLATTEIYDTRTGNSREAAPLTTPRDHLGAARAFYMDGIEVLRHVQAIGGRRDIDFGQNLDANEEYDPQADVWTPRAPLPTARSGIVAVGFGEQPQEFRIHVFGGEGSEGTFDQHEVYHPQTDTWETLEPMPTARHGLGAAVVGDTIYVIGGGETPGLSVSGANEAFTP